MSISAKKIAEAFKSDLARSKNATPESAKLIAALLKVADESYGSAKHAAVDAALDAANKALGMHGVEAIQGKWHDRYYQDIVALYLNSGHTYNTTIVYDTVKEKFSIESWGGFVEAMSEKYEIQ